MNRVRRVWEEVIGLFVDDGSLALLILLLVGGVGLLVKGFGLAPLAGAGAVLAGCLVILGLSLWRFARSGRGLGR